MREVERGQVVVLYTLSLIATFGVVGLVVDLGWANFRQQAAQKAADAAALAAVQTAMTSGAGYCGTQIVCQTPTVCPSFLSPPPSTNFDTACMYAHANGFNASGKQNVTVAAGASPVVPPTVPGTTPAYWVTVRAAESVPQLFSAVMGNAQGMVAARATAGVVPDSGGCIYALDPSAQNAFQVQGSSTLTATCGVYVNSSSIQGTTCDGTATATSFQVVGNYTGRGCSPSPTTGVSPANDPLSAMKVPAAPGGCDHTNLVVGQNQTITLSPGNYCGGIFVGQGANVSFSPGTYYLNGGGFDTTQADTVTGTGVTFIETGPSAGGTPLGMLLQSQSTVTLRAPTTGPQAGLLWYSKGNGRVLNDIQSQTTARLEGLIYTPGEDWLVQGQSQASQSDPLKASYTALVTQTLRVNGSGANFSFSANYSALPGGALFHKVALIE